VAAIPSTTSNRPADGRDEAWQGPQHTASDDADCRRMLCLRACRGWGEILVGARRRSRGGCRPVRRPCLESRAASGARGAKFVKRDATARNEDVMLSPTLGAFLVYGPGRRKQVLKRNDV
jgi:hypothetical protein